MGEGGHVLDDSRTYDMYNAASIRTTPDDPSLRVVVLALAEETRVPRVVRRQRRTSRRTRTCSIAIQTGNTRRCLLHV